MKQHQSDEGTLQGPPKKRRALEKGSNLDTAGMDVDIEKISTMMSQTKAK